MWIYILIIIDILLIVTHFIWGRTMPFWDITLENNIPTFWQSLKTFLAGGLLILFSQKIKPMLWVMIAGFFGLFRS